jgi:hydrogenase nickel incorporation protein HypA/HybF
MHELGIAEQIAKIATEAVIENRTNGPVRSVNIRVGQLTGLVHESLRFGFEVIVSDTLLSGAELRIETVPTRGKCRKCEFEWEISTPFYVCEKCKNESVDIISGRELEITSIEIND